MKKILMMFAIVLLLCNSICLASQESWSQEWKFKPGAFFSRGIDETFGKTIAKYINENDSTVGKIMGYFSIILIAARFICLATMLIMGIRYMFASPEKRGEMKNRSISLFIGLVIVFGASYIMSTVVRFIDTLN